MKQKYQIDKENNEYIIFNLSSATRQPLLEPVAGGTVIDKTFYKKILPNIEREPFLLGQSFHHIFKTNPYIGMAKSSPITHYSSDTIEKYLKKIKWRVKNNIFFADTAGKAAFLGRESHQLGITKYKKYLYFFYVVLVIPVVLDAVYLSVTRKDIFYMVHIPLTFYTFYLIIGYYLLKLFGQTQSFNTYDNQKKLGKNIFNIK